MISIRYRATTHDVNDSDVATLTAELDNLENVPKAALTAAGLRNPVEGQNVSLDDAAAVAVVLALMLLAPGTPERVQLGEPGYRLRALRRGLEAELWPRAAR